MHIIFDDWGKNYFCFSSDLLVIFRTLDARIILPIQRSIYSAFWALPTIMVFVHEISCLIVVFILILSASWNLKKGQWDGPHLIRWFPSVRHPVAQGQLCFALCYYWLLPFWWTPWLRRLWPACSCAWTMTVAVYSTSQIRPSKLPRFMSIDIHWYAREPVFGYRELRVESKRSDAMADRSPWQADVRH